MDKEDMVRLLHSGILAIKRNETGSFVEMWMNLSLSYREKSEREKQISYINACMQNPEKMVQTNLFAGQE